MALQMDLIKTVYEKELIFKNAYWRIILFSGDKENMQIAVNAFADSTEGEPIEKRSYSFKPSVADDAPNPLKQGYEYLKTLDEFANAIDVLEPGQTAA